MSRAYPTREPDTPSIGMLVAPGMCPICKHRPLAKGLQHCGVCDEKLRA